MTKPESQKYRDGDNPADEAHGQSWALFAHVPQDSVRHGEGTSAALEHRADNRSEQDDDANGATGVAETGCDGVGDLKERQPGGQAHQKRYGEERHKGVDLELRDHEDHDRNGCSEN